MWLVVSKVVGRVGGGGDGDVREGECGNGEGVVEGGKDVVIEKGFGVKGGEGGGVEGVGGGEVVWGGKGMGGVDGEGEGGFVLEGVDEEWIGVEKRWGVKEKD